VNTKNVRKIRSGSKSTIICHECSDGRTVQSMCLEKVEQQLRQNKHKRLFTWTRRYTEAKRKERMLCSKDAAQRIPTVFKVGFDSKTRFEILIVFCEDREYDIIISEDMFFIVHLFL
jgi:hypothetical protein